LTTEATIALSCTLAPAGPGFASAWRSLTSELPGTSGLGLFISAAAATLQTLPQVAAAAFSSGQRLQGGSAQIPAQTLGPGKRSPYLSSDDREERLAAIKSVQETLKQLSLLGATQAVVNLGGVPVKPGRALVESRFERGELFDAEGVGGLVEALIEKRSRLSDALLDQACWGLERIIPMAEATGMTLSVAVAEGPWSCPSPREALFLLQEFEGAPLGLGFSTGAWSVLETLGVAGAAERLSQVVAQASAIACSDAVGLRHGFLPGLGEADFERLLQRRATQTPLIVQGGPETTKRELAHAVEFIRSVAATPSG